jgi:hypothetical protein
MQFYTEMPIYGASKKGSGLAGYADIAAWDPTTSTWYIWEVKARGEVFPADPTNVEADGPSDIAHYINAFRSQFPNQKVLPGFALGVAGGLTQPDPLNPKGVLVTDSSTNLGRPAPKYDGVIAYWTEDKNTQSDMSAQGMKAQQATSAGAASPSLPEQVLHWLNNLPTGVHGPGVVPVEPAPVPVLVP